MLNGDSWDPLKYNVSEVIQQEPFAFLELLGYKIEVLDRAALDKTQILTFFFDRPYFENDEFEVPYLSYKEMLQEFYEFHKLGSNSRKPLESNVDKAIDHVKALDEVK